MEQPGPETSSLDPATARALAQDAFIFGAPLVLVSLQADYLSAVTEPVGLRAPVGRFAHARAFVDASNRSVVGFNVDNLYSFAVLDLGDEPTVMSVPDMGERYWIMQVIDAWNGIPGAPGSRTRGGQGGDFLIAGPTWDGDVPDGMELIACPTRIAMIGGRTYCTGPDDYATVNALQDQYRLCPLSKWGTGYEPPAHTPVKEGVDGDTLVNAQFLGLGAEAFFQRLNTLLVDNPAYPADVDALAALEPLGIGAGQPFDLAQWPPDVAEAITAGHQDGVAQMMATAQQLGEMVNGWSLAYDMGRYATHPVRAAWSFVGVGGNLVEDAFYPTTVVDGDGDTLTGSERYTLRFPADGIPPAHAFWSLTMYDAESYLVANELDRYALGDRDELVHGPDGSITIYLQRERPAPDEVPNWLPAPQGPFRLALRLYVPDQTVLDRIWVPPPVRKRST